MRFFRGNHQDNVAMNMVGDCDFERLAPCEWQCRWCKRPLRIRRQKPPRRNCYANPVTRQGLRQRVETDLQYIVDVGAATRTMPEIQATLGKCFDGCREFNGSHCTRRGSVCRHRQNWLLWLSASDCDRYQPMLTQDDEDRHERESDPD